MAVNTLLKCQPNPDPIKQTT